MHGPPWTTRDGLLPADIMARLPRIGIQICYRSVFDEFWLLRIEKLVGISQ